MCLHMPVISAGVIRYLVSKVQADCLSTSHCVVTRLARRSRNTLVRSAPRSSRFEHCSCLASLEFPNPYWDGSLKTKHANREVH
jgi:hypothetical protein